MPIPLSSTSLFPFPAEISPLDSVTATLLAFEFPASLFKFLKQFSSASSSEDDHPFYHRFDPDSFYASLIDDSTHKKHVNQIHARLLVSGLQESGLFITKRVIPKSRISVNWICR